jgi:hypothetical protein
VYDVLQAHPDGRKYRFVGRRVNVKGVGRVVAYSVTRAYVGAVL